MVAEAPAHSVPGLEVQATVVASVRGRTRRSVSSRDVSSMRTTWRKFLAVCFLGDVTAAAHELRDSRPSVMRALSAVLDAGRGC